MNSARSTLAILTSLLGLAHLVFGILTLPKLDLGAMWFLGSGLAFLFLGLMNLLALRRTEAWVVWTGVAANALALVYVARVAFLLRAPQAYPGIVLIGGSVALGLVKRRATA